MQTYYDNQHYIDMGYTRCAGCHDWIKEGTLCLACQEEDDDGQ